MIYYSVRGILVVSILPWVVEMQLLRAAMCLLVGSVAVLLPWFFGREPLVVFLGGSFRGAATFIMDFLDKHHSFCYLICSNHCCYIIA